jgi:hypothetical protein
MKDNERRMKVMWSYGGKCYPVWGMYDKPARLCQWYINQNKDNPKYAGGKLILVSMLKRKTA